MGMTLGVYKPISIMKGEPLGFIDYKFYGYRDTSTMGSIDYLCRILSEDITPQKLSDWFCDTPICTISVSVKEAGIFVGLYVSDVIRHRKDIEPEMLLSRFADIIIALSKMNPDDAIYLCWC